MRLSDAIALGRVLISRTSPHSFCGCAMAMGLLGAGKQPCIQHIDVDFSKQKSVIASGLWRKAQGEEWPWIEEEFEMPALILDGEDQGHGFTNPAIDIISDLFFAVCDGDISLDQLIDWVRSVEPAEAVPAVNACAEGKIIAELAPSLVAQG